MPSKAKLVTRSEITSTVTTDTIPKDDTLTYSELDSNLINLRDATFGLAGDDSATIEVGMGNTIKIAGSGSTTTSASGQTVTITTPSLDPYALKTDTAITVVGDDSTGTNFAHGETVKIAGGNNITTAVSGDTLTITGSKTIDVNEINSGDSSAIQINDSVNVSGTLNAKTIVTNDLISQDSSAINVLDGLNVSGTLSADVLDVNELSSNDSTAIQINDALNVSGATTINNTLAVTGDITTADSLQFDTAAAEAVAAGKLYYSSAYGTLAHGLSDGSELIDGVDLVTYVTNAEATDLVKGEVVYIYGAQGDRPSVKRADNLGDSTSSKTLGIVKNNINTGSAGYVVTQGIVTNLNLGTYTAGDVLWLGTGGEFTATKPTYPAHLVFIGVVLRANAGNGLVYVKPQNGYELDELHNVSLLYAQPNDILKYDGSAWVNSPGGELIYNGNSITAASNADIDITAGGTGNINLNADTIRLGDSGANATLTTNGAGDIIINTNAGTDSGSITIADGANGNISLVVNGSGNVELGSQIETTTNFPSTMTNTSYDPTSTRVRGAIRAYSNLSYAPYTSGDDTHIGNVDYTALKTNGGTFISTATRNIGSDHTVNFDLNGATVDAGLQTSGAYAVRASRSQVYYKNTAGGTKTGFIGVGGSAFLQVDSGHGGAFTVPQIHGHNSAATIAANTGETTTVTQYRGFVDLGLTTAGTGTPGTAQVLGDYYGFYTGIAPSSFGSGTVLSNRPYAFYTTNSVWRSRVGLLDQFRFIGLSATHSSGANYNIDLGVSGTAFHTVTLTSNITGFTFTNAPTSTNAICMVRLMFQQDGTGGRTISFTAGGSEIFLYKNGIKTLTDSTAAPEGLIVDVFSRYDGTNTRYYWNIDNGEYVL